MILILLCACGSETNTPEMGAPDLAVRCSSVRTGGACNPGDYCYVGFEMSYSCVCGKWVYMGGQPFIGCNSLLCCLQGCSTGDTACENDCVTNATDEGLKLYNQAFYFCPASKFCGQGTHTDAGAGGPACNATDLDPNVTFAPPDYAQPSAACSACLDEFFSQSGASTRFQQGCASDLTACRNDMP